MSPNDKQNYYRKNIRLLNKFPKKISTNVKHISHMLDVKQSKQNLVLMIFFLDNGKFYYRKIKLILCKFSTEKILISRNFSQKIPIENQI